MKTLLKAITSSMLIGALLFSSGCASIVTGTHRKVTFKSNPEGAKIVVVNEKGKPYFMGRKYTLNVAKDGYWETKQEVKSTLNGRYLGNLIFGGLVGLIIVDPLTGAMYTLPKEVSVNLNPKTAASLEGASDTSADEPELRVVHLQDLPESVRVQIIPIN